MPVLYGHSFQEFKMNYLVLKAQRQSLGLTVAEIAEICNVTKRSFQYWEAGKVPVPSDVSITVDAMASHYALVLEKMRDDVKKATVHNDFDETKPSRISPKLPFYHTFELFQTATNCPNITYWRIYQSVVGQLLLQGDISNLDDAQTIPDHFGIWKWLDGAYEHI